MSEPLFRPELLKHRAQAVLELNSRGFEWLSHYSSVSPVHDIHGIEVRGIRRKAEAQAMLAALERIFPTWNHSRVVFKAARREPGWMFQISRD